MSSPRNVVLSPSRARWGSVASGRGEAQPGYSGDAAMAARGARRRVTRAALAAVAAVACVASLHVMDACGAYAAQREKLARALARACHAGDVHDVTAILAGGAAGGALTVDTPLQHGAGFVAPCIVLAALGSASHDASHAGHAMLVRALAREHGANVDATAHGAKGGGYTALMFAALGGSTAVVSAVLEVGASASKVVSQGPMQGSGALSFAVANGQPAVARLLLEAGGAAVVNAHVEHGRWGGFTPLMSAIVSIPVSANDVRSEEKATDAIAPSAHTDHGPSLVPRIRADGRQTYASSMFSQRSRLPLVNTTSKRSNSRMPLDASQSQRRPHLPECDAVWPLLDDAASIADEDEAACRMVSLLLEYGADPEAAVTSGRSAGLTSLMLAARVNSATAVRELVRAGADVDARAQYGEFEGRSALEVAAARGSLRAVRQLLDAGADPTVAGPDGLDAVATAAWYHQGDVVRELSNFVRCRRLLAGGPYRSDASVITHL